MGLQALTFGSVPKCGPRENTATKDKSIIRGMVWHKLQRIH